MVSQMDPALVKACNEIAARGGPTRLPGASTGVLIPVIAPPAVRASARLRGFQPDGDALKTSDPGVARRIRRSSEGLLPGTCRSLNHDRICILFLCSASDESYCCVRFCKDVGNLVRSPSIILIITIFISLHILQVKEQMGWVWKGLPFWNH